MNESDVMVYLMTGFLDSGKTQFLDFTLKQDYFQIDGKTLLILCEEGEEEYNPMELLKYGVVIEKVEDQEDLTEEWLEEMNKKHEPERVVIEYNGMWKVSDFEKMKLPGGKTVMLIDTVGLVRRLPHQLVQAFHSTLEQAAECR